MAGLGIILGILVFFFSGAFISDVALHSKDAAAFPGLVLGIWTAWPFFHHARVRRCNLLHPVPKEYPVPRKVAFTKVRDVLADISYNFGDKWQVGTTDTFTGRMSASLRFTDEETRFDADARGHIHTRKERVQRFVELDIHFRTAEGGNTLIQLDFFPKVEGANLFACDSIVAGVCDAIENALGAGNAVGDQPDTNLPAPPWWLLGLSAFALLGLWDGVMKAVFR